MHRSEEQVQAGRGASVLVTYASTYGSTKGIAERIAAGIRRHGHRVGLRPVDEVDGIETYDAVILGSAVFDQRWMPEAERFVRRNLGALTRRPLWLFSVGTFGDRKRIIGRFMTHEPKDIGDIRAALHPREYRVFAGVIDRRRWPLLPRMLFHVFGARLGDNRDWADIEQWAERIADGLAAPARR